MSKEPIVAVLPASLGSLAGALPSAEPGTLFVLGSAGGMRVGPGAGFTVVFGRNDPDVHVCVGAGDRHVSRRHGTIGPDGGGWMLTNLGRLPIRVPTARLLLGGESVRLPVAYLPLFIVGPQQEHLLQVRVAAGPARSGGPGGHPGDDETRTREVWPLSADERLVLACLAGRYLRQEPAPQPLTWAQVADELGTAQPGRGWTWRRAAHLVTNVRKRLAPVVPGLLEDEVPPPVGNALNHNLIVELLVTTTITTGDLRLLER